MRPLFLLNAALLVLGAAPALVAQTPDLFAMIPNQIDAGGPTVTLPVYGKDFVNGAIVFWGATPLPTAFVDSGRLQATVPGSLTALAAEVNITVRNPNGAVSKTSPVYVQPVLLTVGPPVPRSSQSAIVTVTGRGFTPSTGIYLAVGLPRGLITTYVDSTTLRGVVPADMAAISAQATVRLMGPGNTHSRDLLFVIGTPPILSSISPSETVIDGPGLTLTLSGSGFLPGAAARSSESPLPTVFVSSTQLLATIDASLLRRSVIFPGGGYTIRVVNPDGGLSTFQPFFVRENTPTISRLEPASVFAGAPSFTLNITGTGYYSGSRVKLQSQPLSTQFVSPTQLSAVVPEALVAKVMQASVTVVNGETIIDAGASSAAFGFPIKPPALDSVVPASVKAGAASFTLTVNGTGFFAGHSIRWGGSPLPTRYISPTQLSAAVEAGRVSTPGSIAITVVSAGGAASDPIEFRIDPGAPAITSLSPSAVAAGSPVFTLTVRGSNFTSGSVVQWNGAALPTSFVGPSEVTATVASHLVARPVAAVITVATPGGLSNPLPFAVSAALPAVDTGGVVNSFSGQPVIAPGCLVTIYGANLAARSETAEGYPLPTLLAGASVTIDGRAAPLLYAGPNQLNVQAPFELTPGPAVLVIDVAGARSAAIPISVANTAPGILRIPETNHALAVNVPGGALNSADAPARPGDYIVAYMTGQGLLDAPIAAGEAAPPSPFLIPAAPIAATVGGAPAEVAFAGLAPGYAGLLQVNIKVPAIGPGEHIFEVSIGGATSNATVLSIGDRQADRASLPFHRNLE